jgi:hypothetical protein
MSITDAIHQFGRQMGRVFPDRSKTVGASEIGLCARRIHWQKTAQPKDAAMTRAKKQGDMRGATQAPENWGAHVRGTTMEQMLWEPAMRAKFGASLKMAGKDQKTLVVGNLSATPDGLVAGKGGELLKYHGIKYKGDVVVESKTIDPRVNLLEEKSENAFQVQVQMGIIRELTKYKPEYAVISYIDASFWHDVTEFVVQFKPEAYESAKVRASKILKADAADLKPEGWIKGGKECNWCAWSRRCNEMRGTVPEEIKEINPQVMAELSDLCRQALEIQQQQNADGEAYRTLQDQIRSRLQELGTKKIPGMVSWNGVKGRVSWDTKAMLEELAKRGVDTTVFQSVGEPTTQLVIDKKIMVK